MAAIGKHWAIEDDLWNVSNASCSVDKKQSHDEVADSPTHMSRGTGLGLLNSCGRMCGGSNDTEDRKSNETGRVAVVNKARNDSLFDD